MLNFIWLGMILLALLLGGYNGTLEVVTKGAFTAAEDAVMKIALPLVGVWAIWLGMMRLAEKAGLIQGLARLLRPIMIRLFPDVPPEHPAMGAMVLNMGANMLGIGNAATPLGLKAMAHLETLNPHPGTASNAMCTFLTINTSSIQLLPISAITLLAVNGAAHPTAIVSSAFLATFIATLIGLVAVKLLEKLPAYRLPALSSISANASRSVPSFPLETPSPAPETDADSEATPAFSPTPPASAAGLTLFYLVLALILGLFLLTTFPAFFRSFPLLAGLFPALLGKIPAPSAEPVFVLLMRQLSLFAVPSILAILPLYAAIRKIPVYEEFVDGARESFATSIRVIPYLVGMLVAIKMFRDSGGMMLLVEALRPALAFFSFPPELVPLGLMRSLSGSGSLALLTEMITNPLYGPDHLLTLTAATIYGSSETTFYVIAVYFGSVAIRRTRHAIPAGLIADFAGIVASIWICRLLFA